MEDSVPLNKSYKAELILSFLAATVSIGASLVVAGWQPDDLWPLPALYLFEIAALGLVGMFSRARDTKRNSIDWGAVTWAATGFLLAFVILGGFSIGPFLIPAVLALGLAGVLGDLRQRRNLLQHVFLMLVSALLQAALMLSVIGFF